MGSGSGRYRWGDTRVVAQWDDVGVAEASVPISGELVAAAVPEVRKYWVSL
ncbi:hypothetical protein [Arthrobacter sp. 24S4-2]|uniref:hypothetical protein n=1 Tax=Arthrobacter sp. 24S4-2 TaxID=2575374 RepID=UPI001C2F8E2A|nr:hypothetical protein [Arthrobacter sp. 24S4-2]